MAPPPLPTSIAGFPVPQDDVSLASWRWAARVLPRYLLTHSVRSYCWGAAIAAKEGWVFDAPILWSAALFHDVGLTTTGGNTMCFEVEGAELARRTLEGFGMDAESADRAAIAIILHMRPGVTLADGVESVLLDRATAVDVRGVEIELVEGVRADVTRAYPREAFDRHFVRAIKREVARRRDCQSARVLGDNELVDRMAHSVWAAEATPA